MSAVPRRRPAPGRSSGAAARRAAPPRKSGALASRLFHSLFACSQRPSRSLETRLLYGRAMQAKGLDEAAVKVFTEALRRKKGRSPALLREALYWRAVSYERLGKRAQAAREFEKLYAEAPDFRDVARRLVGGK